MRKYLLVTSGVGAAAGALDALKDSVDFMRPVSERFVKIVDLHTASDFACAAALNTTAFVLTLAGKTFYGATVGPIAFTLVPITWVLSKTMSAK